MNSAVNRTTKRIAERSRASRTAYLELMRKSETTRANRWSLSCGNLAHDFAACSIHDKALLQKADTPNIAIISAYNDVLSAHQPYGRYPDIIKESLRGMNAVAQVAGGVPAMCDGVTQGQVGMELSLFSRDVIAMSTAVGLSHGTFDGVLCLSICDKIVPGMLIGALSFGFLPTIFVPSGPMPSGLPNKEKVRIRQEYAQGRIDRKALLEAESRAYHAPGTCTFYGTANSNQMIMEFLGLHLPGSSFVPPNSRLRDALTCAAARRVVALTALGHSPTPLYRIVDERSIVNAMVALLATGGSTNHLIHLPAVARAAGIRVCWDDFSDLSREVPLLTRIYPNGEADINDFHQAGGTTALMSELLDAGLLHEDVETVMGRGLDAYRKAPCLSNGELSWEETQSSNSEIIASVAAPFAADGGIKVLYGNLGTAIIKVSAVKKAHRRVEAPALVFRRHQDVSAAFSRGELNRDVVIVLRFQGPKANGMPELHKLSPVLGTLQDQGYQVALVTDGRMSGASGKFPAAIHVTPECLENGPISLVQNGDIIRLDGDKGRLDVKLDGKNLAARKPEKADLSDRQMGFGRELFSWMRRAVGGADTGATVFFDEVNEPSHEKAD